MDITLGSRLHTWRKHKGVTLREACDAGAGVTPQMISLVENDECSISVASLERLCRLAFRISLFEFFGPLPAAPDAVVDAAPAKQERRRGR